jgi:hypothetical protein
MNVLYDLAEEIVQFMDSSPGLAVSLVYIIVAAVPVTVLHELGHAVAARRLLGGDVRVSVGSAGKLAEMRLGQIALSVNVSHTLAGLLVSPNSTVRARVRETCC